jgi:hypothetical protein
MQKDSTRVLVGILAGVALVAALTMPGYAHHGWGGNEERESTLTGTLESPVSLAGPHATMKLRVNGQVWDITLAPSGRTAAAGLTEKVIPVGSTVTVVGHRNKTTNRFEMKTERVTYNDRVYAVYPNQH